MKGISAAIAFLFVCSAFAQDGSAPAPGSTNSGSEGSGGGTESIVPGNRPVTRASDEEIPVESAPSVEEDSLADGAQGTSERAKPPEEYVIQTGDTLWALCEKFLGNPWYWPKLWALNQYIENPHLIYPGNRISFFGGSETAPPRLDIVSGEGESPAPSADEAPVVEEAKETLPSPEKPINQDAAFSPYIGLRDTGEVAIKLKSLTYISERRFKDAGKITHSGDPKIFLTAGDRAYISFRKGQKVEVGDQFFVVEPIKKIKDPTRFFSSDLGLMVKKKAIVRILARHKDTIEGFVTQNEEMVKRGDLLIPYESPFKRVVPHDLTRRVEGIIVEGENEQFLIGMHDFVFLNMGKKQGIDEGARLVVVRRGDSVLPGEEDNLPYVIYGRLLVVETGDRVSTAYVTDLRDSLSVGDKVFSSLD